MTIKNIKKKIEEKIRDRKYQKMEKEWERRDKEWEEQLKRDREESERAWNEAVANLNDYQKELLAKIEAKVNAMYN